MSCAGVVVSGKVDAAESVLPPKECGYLRAEMISMWDACVVRYLHQFSTFQSSKRNFHVARAAVFGPCVKSKDKPLGAPLSQKHTIPTLALQLVS